LCIVKWNPCKESYFKKQIQIQKKSTCRKTFLHCLQKRIGKRIDWQDSENEESYSVSLLTQRPVLMLILRLLYPSTEATTLQLNFVWPIFSLGLLRLFSNISLSNMTELRQSLNNSLRNKTLNLNSDKAYAVFLNLRSNVSIVETVTEGILKWRQAAQSKI